MTHKNALQIVLTLFVLGNSILYAQVDRIELGDKYFEQFAYEKAITLYKGAVDRGEKDWKVYAKLGDCFYYTSDSENAVNYYRLAFKEKSNNMDLYRLRFAQSLISSKGCDNAISSLDTIGDAPTIKVIWDYFLPDEKYNKDLVVLKSKICKEKEKLNEDIIVDSLSINTKASDFGGVFNNGILYFTSSRKNPYKDKKINKRRYNWNDQPYLDIYEALLVENSDSINSMLVPIDVSKIGDSINNNAHQSGVTISRDSSKIMFYVSGEVTKTNKLKYNKRGTSILKIQKAIMENNRWVKDKSNTLDKINLENFSIGNPALNKDNSKLYFVTCAPYPNAKGQSDIYYIDLKDGEIPKDAIVHNLGIVNTPGRESFPFISEDNILYFSSDGIYEGEAHLGLLDIYSFDLDKQDSVKALPMPFNSNKDDFAYFERKVSDSSSYSKQGYFSTNRDTVVFHGGTILSKGDDDIYSFKEKRKCKQTIQGYITDSETKKYIEGATVKLINEAKKVVNIFEIDAAGAYKFNVECKQNFIIRVSKDGYHDEFKEFNSDETAGNFNLKLNPIPCNIPIHIEFARDSSYISTKAKDSLKLIYDLLLTNPDMRIKIESHTDSRGSKKHNKQLSQKRADSTKEFLIKIGVDKNQILDAIGRGEECLDISDEEISELTDEDDIENAHLKNRRSIFIIEGCDEELTNCQEEDP